MSLHAYLKRIVEQRETLARAEARALLHEVLAGSPEAEAPGSQHSLQLAALLGAISARGETVGELAGFVDALRAAAIPIPLTDAERDTLVDTCGTGADASGTFNISTAAALVAAAAGATVAKHGNRAVTSQCGSADVLEALGIPTGLSPEAVSEALRRHRFAFLHAPTLHPAMLAAMPVRRALAIRTVFNLLGPLANPAGARAQVMGVYAPHLVPLVAEAMVQLGRRHAFVVHGTNHQPSAKAALIQGAVQGMDELSISGLTSIAEVAGSTITATSISPADFQLPAAPIESLRGGDARHNASILRTIFAGEPGPRRDVVLLNAAAVLTAADLAPSIALGIPLAARAIDSGAVTALVAALAATAR